MLELGFSKLIQPILSTTTSVPNLGMDPAHGSEVLKHLNKQNQALSEAHATMFRELEVLQVEEEMLMRKLYEIMSKNGLFNKDAKRADVSDRSSDKPSQSEKN